ncbi:acetate--CoA ligase family protein [Asticcacaulis benevestitus]|uniref:ATP-grasp domain-containing protein n=1 Tax=Asticcacaulis benevestitus DSM 16100 = ATCC BAA-896 TaxID=1121022 RepID=V4PUH3_9CAUL|nr:acetate--CoA ligase family protein [Asticcacaulis benevestitus]ESQ91029.1 hypothetical protein ABENE_11295 [Asticcacaulis benevestitus DSM 16100 = ATCC BAA-896]
MPADLSPSPSVVATAPPTDRLLRPRSVAIVGASDKPRALGTSVLANLDRNGFRGDIYLINPKRETIGDRPCLSDISALPEDVDVAVLAIPKSAVLDAVRALAARKCGAVIIFSAGFAEGGEEGIAAQLEIGRIASEAGMIIEGPNCLGIVNYIDGIPLTFVETQAEPLGALPGIGIVSQSGAMACVLGVTLSSRALGLSYSISTGNEAASGVEDYVEYLVDDPNTRVIAMIVEQFRKPKSFLDAAARAREAGKTIVLLHPGKSQAARASAVTHTGAMAGDYVVMRAKVERAGVVFAETLEELADIAEIAARCAVLPAGGTAVLGESGAFKALTLDLCESLEVVLPVISDIDSPVLRAALPDFVGVSNPLDITAQGLVEPDLYTRTLKALLEDDRFGVVVMGIIQTDSVTVGIKLPPILKALNDHKPLKPVIFAGLDEGANVPDCKIAELRRHGVPCFPSSERAFRAIKRLTQLADRDLGVRDVQKSPIPLPANAEVIPEYQAKALLAPAGIPFPPSRFVTSLEEAQSAAVTMGYPVVIKAQSAALSHKSDAGGVIVGLRDPASLSVAWETLYANVAAYDPNLRLEGVLVEKMGLGGTELIVGAKTDPDWGPVILFGFGGITAEILQDVRVVTPDLTIPAIVRELNSLKQAALLHGFRGTPALDLNAVAELIARVGNVLISTPDIAELDLNPVVVYPKGAGVVALDALILTAQPN